MAKYFILISSCLVLLGCVGAKQGWSEPRIFPNVPDTCEIGCRTKCERAGVRASQCSQLCRVNSEKTCFPACHYYCFNHRGSRSYKTCLDSCLTQKTDGYVYGWCYSGCLLRNGHNSYTSCLNQCTVAPDKTIFEVCYHNCISRNGEGHYSTCLAKCDYNSQTDSVYGPCYADCTIRNPRGYEFCKNECTMKKTEDNVYGWCYSGCIVIYGSRRYKTCSKECIIEPGKDVFETCYHDCIKKLGERQYSTCLGKCDYVTSIDSVYGPCYGPCIKRNPGGYEFCKATCTVQKPKEILDACYTKCMSLANSWSTDSYRQCLRECDFDSTDTSVYGPCYGSCTIGAKFHSRSYISCINECKVIPSYCGRSKGECSVYGLCYNTCKRNRWGSSTWTHCVSKCSYPDNLKPKDSDFNGCIRYRGGGSYSYCLKQSTPGLHG